MGAGEVSGIRRPLLIQTSLAAQPHLLARKRLIPITAQIPLQSGSSGRRSSAVHEEIQGETQDLASTLSVSSTPGWTET